MDRNIPATSIAHLVPDHMMDEFQEMCAQTQGEIKPQDQSKDEANDLLKTKRQVNVLRGITRFSKTRAKQQTNTINVNISQLAQEKKQRG